MATYKATFETGGIDALRRRAQQLDGMVVEFGILSPAPRHTGGGSSSTKGVSTAFLLARVEFGVGSKPKAKVRARGRRRRKGLVQRLSRLLRGFRSKGRGRARSAPSKPQRRERPIIRWVARERRREMVRLFRVAALRTFAGRDPMPPIDALGQQLAAAMRDRMDHVRAVRTGQTKRAITYRVRP